MRHEKWDDSQVGFRGSNASFGRIVLLPGAFGAHGASKIATLGAPLPLCTLIFHSLVFWFSLVFSNQGNSLVFRVFLCFSRVVPGVERGKKSLVFWVVFLGFYLNTEEWKVGVFYSISELRRACSRQARVARAVLPTGALFRARGLCASPCPTSPTCARSHIWGFPSELCLVGISAPKKNI